MISRFGGIFFSGDDNLANPGALDYILEATRGSLYDRDLYPTALEKAAAISWHIIQGHIFHDGNKRTGVETCRMILELNGIKIAVDKKFARVAIKIAKGDMSFANYLKWLSEKI